MIARKQTEKYSDMTVEEQKKLLEEHTNGSKPGGEQEIKSVSSFIDATSEAQSYVEYLWSKRGWHYDAFYCKIPSLVTAGSNSGFGHLKLFVQESCKNS